MLLYYGDAEEWAGRNFVLPEFNPWFIRALNWAAFGFKLYTLLPKVLIQVLSLLKNERNPLGGTENKSFLWMGSERTDEEERELHGALNKVQLLIFDAWSDLYFHFIRSCREHYASVFNFLTANNLHRVDGFEFDAGATIKLGLRGMAVWTRF